MRKTAKILAIMLMLVSIFCVTVNANTTSSGVNPSGYTGQNVGNLDTTGIGTIGNQIIRIVSTIGSVASVIVLVVLGIKYMMGSAEEKAEYKKTLLPYIIGAALVFAASGIATIIFNFTQNIGA